MHHHRIRLVGISVFAGLAMSGGALAGTEEKRLDLNNFQGVAVEGSTNAIIRQGAGFSVVAKGTREALDLLDPVVEKGTLILKPKRRLVIGYVKSHPPVTVYITMPAISRFAISGSGEGTLQNIQAKAITLAIAGSGDIKASGTCETLSAKIAGSGDIAAQDLRCGRVEARIAGSGDISAHATSSALAKIAGSGDIRIHGNPSSREVSTTGSGEIEFVGLTR